MNNWNFHRIKVIEAYCIEIISLEVEMEGWDEFNFISGFWF